jgi:hypothetical protein
MCFGNCEFENWHGECGKKRGDVCPESLEDEKTAEAARITAFENMGEHSWNWKNPLTTMTFG